jgi:Protein of unknown function (DUF2950)
MPEESRPSAPNRIGRVWIIAGIGAFLLMSYVAFAWPIPRVSSSSDLRAADSCRDYATAQVLFKRCDLDAFAGGGPVHAPGTAGVFEYASDLRDLNETIDVDGTINLIDGAFRNARGPKGIPRYGYLFLEMKTLAGKPINWRSEYALCAVPAKYASSGRFTLIIKSDGQVWAKDVGHSQFLTDYPADPRADGWREADNVILSQIRFRAHSLIAVLVVAGGLMAAFVGRVTIWAFRARPRGDFSQARDRRPE